MVKVFVSGCFDVLHSGHIRFGDGDLLVRQCKPVTYGFR